MSIEIRALEPADGAAAGDLFEAIAADPDARHFHPHPMTREAAKAICTRDGRDCYVGAFQAGALVGYGMLRGWDAGYEVPSLGIYLAAQSRGSGLSHRLMDDLHRRAAERGARRVRLKVYAANLRAVALYRRLGYTFTGEEAGQLVGTLELSQDRPPGNRIPEGETR